MNAFIDLGSFRGDTLRMFLGSEEYKKDRWTIFAFEPNPYVTPDCIEHTVFSRKAAWTEDGKIALFVSKRRKTRSGATVMKNKLEKDFCVPVKVKCFDFSKWILDNFNKKDYVVIKFNIEGAEYLILKKMIADGSIHYVNRIYVQFHAHKMKMDKEEQRDLIRQLQTIDGLDLQPDYKGSEKHPERASIEWYLK